MKFLLDAMLGKLARFLRIFGYDTIYANDLISIFNLDPVPDQKLIEYAEKDNRIIITKDYPLHKQYSEKSIFLEGKGVYNYLAQLNERLGLKFEFNIKQARCSNCNSTLKKVEDKKSIKNLVLEETFTHYNEFYQCKNLKCNKIYWKGSHIEDIEKRLEKSNNFK
ncbi:MAG: DUF5615 family PIN-like protein [Promethearchaeota archaeon]